MTILTKYNKLLIIGVFFIIVFSPAITFAQNVSTTDNGSFGTDMTTYYLGPHENALVIISGTGEISPGVEHQRAIIIITLPDGTDDSHRVFSTGDGYFELLYPIDYDTSLGHYKVFA